MTADFDRLWACCVEAVYGQHEGRPILVDPATILAIRDRIAALEAETERLWIAGQKLADELAHWGWGDFHYPDFGQNKRVVAALDEWREAKEAQP